MRITRLTAGPTSPRRLRTLALLGALPLTAVAALQVALWLEAPYGDAVLGGRADTVEGVLTSPYRWAALGQAGIATAMAWLLLARGGLVRARRLGTRGLRTAAGTIAGFMALNTLANLTSPPPLERRVGAATFAVGLAGAALANSATPAAAGATAAHGDAQGMTAGTPPPTIQPR